MREMERMERDEGDGRPGPPPMTSSKWKGVLAFGRYKASVTANLCFQLLLCSLSLQHAAALLPYCWSTKTLQV